MFETYIILTAIVLGIHPECLEIKLYCTTEEVVIQYKAEFPSSPTRCDELAKQLNEEVKRAGKEDTMVFHCESTKRTKVPL